MVERLIVFASLCLCGLAISACAPKAVPVVVGAPKHPEFMFPAVPEGTLPALSGRLDRGWQYFQLDDLRSAEREFGAALKQQATFYPADAAMGYVALARGNEAEALTRFDRALATEATYVPALVGRGQALLEMDRVGDALVSFETALAKDPLLTDLKGRVELLRFRATPGHGRPGRGCRWPLSPRRDRIASAPPLRCRAPARRSPSPRRRDRTSPVASAPRRTHVRHRAGRRAGHIASPDRDDR